MLKLPRTLFLNSRELILRENFENYFRRLVLKSDFTNLLESADIFDKKEEYLFISFLQFMSEYDKISKPSNVTDGVQTLHDLIDRNKIDQEKLNSLNAILSEFHKTVFFSLAFIATEGLDLKDVTFLTRVSKAITESKPAVIDSRKLAYAGMVDSKRDLW